MSTLIGGDTIPSARFFAPSPGDRQLAGKLLSAIQTVDNLAVAELRFPADPNSLGSSEIPPKSPHITGKVYCSDRLCGRNCINEALGKSGLSAYQKDTTDCGQCKS